MHCGTIHMNKKNPFLLLLWIAGLISIGMLLGLLTRPESMGWYSNLHRSPLTPPQYIFPLVWTFLYGLLGVCGWLLWSDTHYHYHTEIKYWYCIQLFLNWSWAPLFFSSQTISGALIVLILMNGIIGRILWLTSYKAKYISLLLAPYAIWILFALYLNIYLWQHNT